MPLSQLCKLKISVQAAPAVIIELAWTILVAISAFPELRTECSEFPNVKDKIYFCEDAWEMSLFDIQTSILKDINHLQYA